MRAGVNAALELLGVSDLFSDIGHAQSFTEAKRRLSAMRDEAERNFKRFALVVHPDRGGTTEAMQHLNAAWDLVRRIDVAPPPPRNFVKIVAVNYGGWYPAPSATTAEGWS